MAVDESAALRNHLDSCDACQTSLEDLRLNVEVYEKKASEHVSALRTRLSEESAEKATNRRLWFTGIGLAAAIAVSMIVVMVWPGEQDDEIAFKGAFSVQVVAQQKDGQIIVRRGEKLCKGDALRFVIVSEVPGYIAVFSVDAKGRVFSFYPEVDPTTSSAPMRLKSPGKHELPGSVILDDWIGKEYLIVVFSREAFDRRRVQQLARGMIIEGGVRELGPDALGIKGSVGVLPVEKVEERNP
jgi:hypothetical protein